MYVYIYLHRIYWKINMNLVYVYNHFHTFTLTKSIFCLHMLKIPAPAIQVQADYEGLSKLLWGISKVGSSKGYKETSEIHHLNLGDVSFFLLAR